MYFLRVIKICWSCDHNSYWSEHLADLGEAVESSFFSQSHFVDWAFQ